MALAYSDRATTLLLDIEGTTTPVDYVFGVLFPYAQQHIAEFLASEGQRDAVQRDLCQLRQEYELDLSHGESLPAWDGADPIAAVSYLNYLMKLDRKSTGLKSLQGKIWNQGYQDGTLRSQVFADVPPAFQRWTEARKQIFIFSSGSVQAQQLLFRYSEFGDLTIYLSGYFDTQTGPKRNAASYEAIAAQIGQCPDQILFISDVVDELRAARVSGMQTLLSLRPGNPAQTSNDFPMITTFDGV